MKVAAACGGAIVLALALLLVFGEYSSKVRVKGQLVYAGGAIKAVAPQFGRIGARSVQPQEVIVAAFKDYVMSISLDKPVAAETVTPPPFFFFATQRAHGFWRYLWPFQSVRQTIITLALTAVLVIICSVVLPESVNFRVRLLIFLCFVITVVRELREQLPGKTTIAVSRGPARQLIPDLKHVILELGYTETSPSAKGDRFHFRPNPELSLFLPKHDVELFIADENIIEVLGAIGSLKQVIMKLNWKLET